MGDPQKATPAGLEVGAWYREHGRFLGRMIARLTKDRAAVDDLLQETFIIAFNKRDTFDGRTDVRAWLYGIAANLCRGHRRSTVRRFRFLGRLGGASTAPQPELHEQVERRQRAAVVQAILDELPFKQREVFVLFELEEMDGAAIATLLGVPLGTVWTRLSVARLHVERALRRQQKRAR